MQAPLKIFIDLEIMSVADKRNFLAMDANRTINRVYAVKCTQTIFYIALNGITTTSFLQVKVVA